MARTAKPEPKPAATELDRRGFLTQRISALRKKRDASGAAMLAGADELEWNRLNNELRELNEAAELQRQAAEQEQTASDPTAVPGTLEE